MTDKILAVSGMGRCGTTLCMQMLFVSGNLCAGRWPDFEPAQIGQPVINQTWLESQAGACMKWLDPTLFTIADPSNIVAIKLRRDLKQQAMSQLKLIKGGTVNDFNRKQMRANMQNLKRHQAATDKLFKTIAHVDVSFDRLIENTETETQRIAEFCLEHGFKFDFEKACGMVAKRSPACRPDMLWETNMLETRKMVGNGR